jgi:predicted ATPase with chaperone activity
LYCTAPLPLRLLWQPSQSLYLVIEHRHEIPDAHLGIILDRIDIHIEVPQVEYEKLSHQRQDEPSATIQLRVEATRQILHQRFYGVKAIDVAGGDTEKHHLRAQTRNPGAVNRE